MAALDFPDTSTLDVGYVHTQNDKSWTWNGVSWEGTTAEAPELLFSIGEFNNSTNAEAAMSEDGFYTWCKTLDGNPACSMLTYKKGNVIFHVTQFSHGETFIVGNELGDNFTSVKTAIQFIQYLTVRDTAKITLKIRPGEYEFDNAIDMSHDNGDNIFIKPIDSAPEVIYPKSTDFTGVSADDLNMLKSRHAVKFKFTTGADQLNSITAAFGTLRLEDILIYKETASVSRGIAATFGAKLFVNGCSFFGFATGILSVESYTRVFDSSFSYMYNTEDTSGMGIKAGTDSYSLIRRNTIYGCESHAISIAAGSTCNLYESVMEECGKDSIPVSEAISITDHSTLLAPRAGTLSGNIVKNCDSGLFLSQSSVSRMGDLTINDSDRWNIRCYSDSNIYIFDPVSLSGSGVGFEDVQVEDGGAVSFTNDVNNILGSITYSSPLNVIDTDGSIIKDNSQPIQSIENWDSTYATVSANSASWGITSSNLPSNTSGIANIGEQGSYTLPGGLIIKYGTVNVNSSSVNVTLSAAFPNAIVGVNCTPQDGTYSSAAELCGISNLSLSAFSVAGYQGTSGAGVGRVFWQATGY